MRVPCAIRGVTGEGRVGHGRHAGVGIDPTSRVQLVSVLDQLIDVEHHYVENRSLPAIAHHEDLQAVRDTVAQATVWKNGPVIVSGGGDSASISIGGYFDPCASGVPVPGC